MKNMLNIHEGIFKFNIHPEHQYFKIIAEENVISVKKHNSVIFNCFYNLKK